MNMVNHNMGSPEGLHGITWDGLGRYFMLRSLGYRTTQRGCFLKYVLRA